MLHVAYVTVDDRPISLSRLGGTQALNRAFQELPSPLKCLQRHECAFVLGSPVANLRVMSAFPAAPALLLRCNFTVNHPALPRARSQTHEKEGEHGNQHTHQHARIAIKPFANANQR